MKRHSGRPQANDARQLAFGILLRVEREEAFASILLDSRENRLADRREAALLHELVLGVLRRRALLDYALSAVSSRPLHSIDPEVLAALRIGAYGLLFLERIPDFAAVDSSVKLVRAAGHHAAAGFANAVLRAVAKAGASLLPKPPAEGDVEGLALFHSHPAWWVRRLVERAGWPVAEKTLYGNNRPAATVLHVNAARTSVERVAGKLAEEGLLTERCRFMPQALRLRSGRLHGSAVAERGEVWVQDEAAQIVTAMLGRPSGPSVADLCAAPGGKTMQLAEALPEGGLLVAADVHPGRLEMVRANAARAGMMPLPLVNADMASGFAPFKQVFHQVLVDAPCSGTGTLRRHPEIRWRLREESLKLFAAKQRAILERASGIVVPGGSLLYAVCSLEPEEGEHVVKEFLEDHADFSAADPRPALPEQARSLIGEDRFLRTSPADWDLDGFFGALLRRRDEGRRV